MPIIATIIHVFQCHNLFTPSLYTQTIPEVNNTKWINYNQIFTEISAQIYQTELFLCILYTLTQIFFSFWNMPTLGLKVSLAMSAARPSAALSP